MPGWRWSRGRPTAPTPPISTSTGRKRNFLIAHFVSGLGWAYFASLGCGECQVDQFPVIKAIVLLLAVAATALIASSLRGALAATFALPVAVYAVLGTQLWTPVEAMMVGLLIVVAALLRLCRRPHEPVVADAAVLPLGEGRADRRTRDREIHVGRGAAARRGSQSRQVALPGLDEPRTQDAAQRHPRLLGGHGQRSARPDAATRPIATTPTTSMHPASICST